MARELDLISTSIFVYVTDCLVFVTRKYVSGEIICKYTDELCFNTRNIPRKLVNYIVVICQQNPYICETVQFYGRGKFAHLDLLSRSSKIQLYRVFSQEESGSKYNVFSWTTVLLLNIHMRKHTENAQCVCTNCV